MLHFYNPKKLKRIEKQVFITIKKNILFSSAIVNEIVYVDTDLTSEHNKKILKEMDDTFDTAEEIA